MISRYIVPSVSLNWQLRLLVLKQINAVISFIETEVFKLFLGTQKLLAHKFYLNNLLDIRYNHRPIVLFLNN